MDIQKKVGEVEYSFQRMNVTESAIFNLTLLRMLGPGLSGIALGKGQSILDADVSSAIGSALAGLDPIQAVKLMKNTIKSMVVFPIAPGKNGKEKGFDEYYEGKEFEMFEAFFACVEVQSGGLIGQLKKKFFTSASNTTDSSLGTPT